MDLKDEFGTELFLLQLLPDVYHGNFDDIRAGALERHIHGGAFPERTEIVIGRTEFVYHPPSSEQRGDVTVALCAFHVFVHIFFDVRIGGKIFVDVVLRPFCADAQILGKSEGADSVNDSEIDGFRASSHLRGDFVDGNAEYLGGRNRMNVLMLSVCLDELLASGKVREKAELYLGIVGVDEYVSGRGDKELSEFLSLVIADGNVLQIRICAGKPSRRSVHLIVGGMNFSAGSN